MKKTSFWSKKIRQDKVASFWEVGGESLEHIFCFYLMELSLAVIFFISTRLRAEIDNVVSQKISLINSKMYILV